MTELYDTICRIVEEKRAARRHPTIVLSLEISQRTGQPVFIIEWKMRELERAGIVHVGRTAGPDYATPRCAISKQIKASRPYINVNQKTQSQ